MSWAESRIAEITLLKSMFPDNDELKFDDESVFAMDNGFATELTISFTLKVIRQNFPLTFNLVLCNGFISTQRSLVFYFGIILHKAERLMRMDSSWFPWIGDWLYEKTDERRLYICVYDNVITRSPTSASVARVSMLIFFKGHTLDCLNPTIDMFSLLNSSRPIGRHSPNLEWHPSFWLTSSSNGRR